jgi:hypothetical protein
MELGGSPSYSQERSIDQHPKPSELGPYPNTPFIYIRYRLTLAFHLCLVLLSNYFLSGFAPVSHLIRDLPLFY